MAFAVPAPKDNKKAGFSGLIQNNPGHSNVNNLQTTPRILDKVNYMDILDFIK